MSRALAIRMPLEDSDVIGRLRLRAGLQVCADQSNIWLKAEDADEALEAELRVLPGIHFSILTDGQLVECGKRVPQGHLPQKTWKRLVEWINVELPQPLYAGRVEQQSSPRLVRSKEVQEPNVLRTTKDVWGKYALTAPQLRLNRLSFAMGEENQVVICGTPLPPCTGVRYVERSKIAVQAGWCWQPEIDAEVILKTLPHEDFALAMFHADQTWDLIPADAFVHATRSAVRESLKGISHG